jgi:RHS repeat-associated protein
LCDHLLSETTPQGSVAYTYDADERRQSMTVSGQAPVSYSFDNASRLTSIVQGASGVSFAYDSDGRRTSLTLPNGVVANYSYDAASQLTGIVYAGGALGGANLEYSYDLAGRRVSVSGSLASTQLPAPVSSAVYNANNQLTQWGSTAMTYDADGNTLSDGTNTYVWDARNRLVSADNNGAVFSYDPLGRRVAKTILSTSTNFLYDGANPVQELNGATPTANLLTGGIDERFTRTDASGTYDYLTDALGSTVALTDSTGASQVQYSYAPYGAMSITGTTTNSYAYTGREFDGLGINYYRARYYNPATGRFLSEDPLGFEGGINKYAYAGNNPINFRDPSGLDKKSTGFCSLVPSGRTTGISFGVGGIGSVGGGLELVENYDTGQVSGFAYGGMQLGWNGGASGSVYTGGVQGLNGSNSNYSGGFTGFNGGAGGVGVWGASSSGGLTGGVNGLVPNGNVNASGVSLGKGLLTGPSGGFTATNYSNPVQLGKYWYLIDPVDQLMFLARQLCK